jgi:hypothetical protein
VGRGTRAEGEEPELTALRRVVRAGRHGLASAAHEGGGRGGGGSARAIGLPVAQSSKTLERLDVGLDALHQPGSATPCRARWAC